VRRAASSKTAFVQKLTTANLSHFERALGLLWYYRETQEFEERTPAELAGDLLDLGFTRPHVSRLKEKLTRSRLAVAGARAGTKRINARYSDDLEKKFAPFLDPPKAAVTDSIIPSALVKGSRRYLEQMVHQINGSFDRGFYDCTAVLMRRMMESLIVECYVAAARQNEIKANGRFLMLDSLIKYLATDQALSINPAGAKTMGEIKQLGDTAAHDRYYITLRDDISDIRASYRRLITTLLSLSKIVP